MTPDDLFMMFLPDRGTEAGDGGGGAAAAQYERGPWVPIPILSRDEEEAILLAALEAYL